MTTWVKLVIAATLATGAAGVLGCSSDKTSSIPSPRVSQATASDTPPASQRDTTPKASDAFKDGVTPPRPSGDPQQADPSHTMTRQEESTAMPMAGQANDHSTLAKDPAKK